MSETEPNGRWRFERSFNVGHLLVSGTVAVTAIGGYFELKGRTEAAERAIAQLERRLDRESVQQDAAFGEIKGTLRRIEDKLDRKADKP